MPGEGPVQALVGKLSGSGILVSSDVSPIDIEGVDTNALATRIIESLELIKGLRIANKELVAKIKESMKTEKTPDPIEYVPKADFSAYAAEVEANYKISTKETEVSGIGVDGFVTYFKDRLSKVREFISPQRIGMTNMASSMESLKNFSDGREITVIGMVLNKIVTKNGNIMAVLDDETGECKVIFMNGTSQKAKLLFEKARHIVNDEVMAVSGKISGPFIIASELIWPDVPIKQKKSSEEDVAIAFISDPHVGSKLFMEKNFVNFIKWLNGGYGERKDLAGKVKYLVIGGDVVDGIGIYPNQDRDLAVLDIYSQYQIFMNMISAVPDHIQTFIIPGNHDAVQRAEPQPALTPSLLRDFRKDNIHMIPNPSFLTLHGTDVLVYHGTSLDSVIRNIPGTSYAAPDTAMIEVLKRRHLSPIYGGNIIVPSKKDNLVIDKVPDILHMGHVHKNCLQDYHGIGILNSGTWQARTDFQVLQGHIPTPCILTIYETKHNRFSTVNFDR